MSYDKNASLYYSRLEHSTSHHNRVGGEATMTIFSATILSPSAILGTGRECFYQRSKVINNFNGLNLFGVQKTNNHVASLSLITTMCSLKTPSQAKGEKRLLQPKDKKHFVLLHTGCHGSWCWYKIVELMKSSGHNVTALDLGGSGSNEKQAIEITSFSDYLSPLMKFMASLPADEKIVLVGHSFAGLGISKAMENFPEKISVAVFIAALMPGPSFSATAVYTKTCDVVIPELDNRVIYDNGPANPPTSLILGPKFMETNLYQLSPITDLKLATELVRPIYLYPVEEIYEEIVLSTKRYGSVKRVFIIAAESKALNKEFQYWMIENNPPDDVEEISGSDHMVMMSKPQQLFTTLLHIANSHA
ncbi:methyl jasmonate esterase 1 isoform X2 [Solanum lycopersicum]|uniref:methyl jasmonate esterase 1 isoform X2 n=1 Tax=Solanum lycopersicum TaxID=4081 RepID=UPI0002768602|nr:polyneuridine-aldehyde esterase [Solanum lycopersicum]